MDSYVSLFIDEQYPSFLDKYLKTKTLKRIQYVTQFCGCDYTNLYHPLFLYTRFDHSIVAAHMTWHFTHDKKQTIATLLHDTGTPCFAHCIDYVFGDYMDQETSEKSIITMIQQDPELMSYLEEDGISLDDLADFSNYPILENKSPRLCTDRLDGVFGTCYIWLHTHSLEQIKKVYDDITVLINEDGKPELGFKTIELAEKFMEMVHVYAKELQGNTDKFTMKYISEIVKLSFEQHLVTLEELYTKKEEEICQVFASNFSSWQAFKVLTMLTRTETEPSGQFYASFDTKKRNVVPLVVTAYGNQRITEASDFARMKYEDWKEYQDSKYVYAKTIQTVSN